MSGENFERVPGPDSGDRVGDLSRNPTQRAIDDIKIMIQDVSMSTGSAVAQLNNLITQLEKASTVVEIPEITPEQALLEAKQIVERAEAGSQ